MARGTGRARQVLGALLALLALAGPGPVEAQRSSRAEAGDFLVFLQSTASRRPRVRARHGGLPLPLRSLYARWAARYADRIARGEAIFHQALTDKNRAHSERAKREEVERALDELAQSPKPSSPITLNDSMRKTCAGIMRELEKQRDP